MTLDINESINKNITAFDHYQFHIKSVNGSMITRDGYWDNDYFYTKSTNADDVFYKINKDGFRTDNFEVLNKENLNILYSGCSFSFGQDIPQEFRWSDFVTNYFNNIKNTKGYNLSMMGASIHLIIKNICTFINNYGIPDVLVMILPDIHRKMIYSTYTDQFIPAQLNFDKDNTVDWMYEELLKYKENYMPQENAIIYLTMIDLLENLFKANGSIFLWSTWHIDSESVFDNFANRYSSYFKIPTPYPDYTKKDYGNSDVKYWFLAGDNQHPGGGWNKEVSEKVIDLINKRLEFGGK